MLQQFTVHASACQPREGNLKVEPCTTSLNVSEQNSIR